MLASLLLLFLKHLYYHFCHHFHVKICVLFLCKNFMTSFFTVFMLKILLSSALSFFVIILCYRLNYPFCDHFLCYHFSSFSIFPDNGNDTIRSYTEFWNAILCLFYFWCQWQSAHVSLFSNIWSHVFRLRWAPGRFSVSSSCTLRCRLLQGFPYFTFLSQCVCRSFCLCM
jgi:hypothetical protein